MDDVDLVSRLGGMGEWNDAKKAIRPWLEYRTYRTGFAICGNDQYSCYSICTRSLTDRETGR